MHNPHTQRNKCRIVSAHVAGPNPYRPAAGGNPRPTITLPCKDIESIDDIEMWCTDGYEVKPIALVRNVVTFAVYFPTTAHAHDLETTGIGGAVDKSLGHATEGAPPAVIDLQSENVAGGALTVVGGVPGNGIQVTPAGVTAGVAGVELDNDAHDLSLIVFKARAWGKV